ncbi:MAG: IS110 family transposase [Actinobacteria bacterium RBG_16_68_21]|nr:MAG: IS110 family transposase [Actinobacteria bacterium RBG_16_68_21]
MYEAQTVAEIRGVGFVGIDWATERHAVCVLDASGVVTGRLVVAHSRDGFGILIGRLAGFGPPGRLPVGIERPDGRLVDALLEAGHPVVAVSPKAIKTWREGEVRSGAKDDPGDAEVIAEYLRLRAAKLTVAIPFSDHTRALRAGTRARDDLVVQRVAARNQLEACLDSFWPGAKGIFAELTSGIALAFLERYPTPAAAQRLGEKRLGGFLAKHHYSGRRSAAELLGRLRAAPGGILTGPEAQARGQAVAGYVRVIRALNGAIAELDHTIVTHLGEHPDGEIFTSLPRAGRISAAQMLAEWGDCRQAYDGPEAVAALAGTTPVTRRSGKHQAVSFRRACNKRFRKAITTFADNSRHASPWAAKVYHDAITRGCDHPHAIRILARAWIRIIWRCWNDHTPYNPHQHGAAARLEEQQTTKQAA